MTGVGQLIRLILRRDRLILPSWVVLLAVVPVGYLASVKALFPTESSQIEYARVSADNAGFVALYGPLHGTSIGELVVWRAGFLPVLIGLAALLTVIRHTRAEEEAGRTELLGAAAVARPAQLVAALSTTGAASVLLGLIVLILMVGQGLSVVGSLVFGAEFTLTGWLFAGIAAITAQVNRSARGARSVALAVLGAAYALRVGGDISTLGDHGLAWLSWVSPIGWVQHLFAYGANAWWPAVLSVLGALAAICVASALLGRRDLGAGLLPIQLGRASAPASLRSPITLAWRLQRGPLLGWTIAFALLGLVFGGVGASVVQLSAHNSGLGDVLTQLGGAGTLVNSYFAGTAGIVALIAACYAVQAVLQLRDEEQLGHAEAVLSTPVSRFGWAGSHLIFALLGPAVALAAEGLAAGASYHHGKLGASVAAALVQLPAVWVLAAVTVVLIGLLPRFARAAWCVPLLCLLIMLLGETLQLNHWLLDLSPFTHIPRLPSENVRFTPLVSLMLVTIALGVAGLVGLRRRDLPG